MIWMQLLSLMGIVLLVWLLYKTVQRNPQSFSKASLNQSVWTMGILAIGLIVFVGCLVLLLRV